MEGESREPGIVTPIVCVVLLIIGLVLCIVQHVRTWGTPENSVEFCLELARAGDTDTLRSERRCGILYESIGPLIHRLGENKFRRIVRTYERAYDLGNRRYREMERQVWDLGDARFRRLPRDEQRAIRSRSRDEWIMAAGLSALNARERGIISTSATFRDARLREAAIIELGEVRMDSEQRAQVHGRTNADLEANPDTRFLARLRRSHGETAMRRAERTVRRAGERALRDQTSRARRRIIDRSYREYVVHSGLDALSDLDRQVIPRAELVLRGQGVENHCRALGRSLLEPHERELLPAEALEQFRANHDAYVPREGRLLAQAYLRRNLGVPSYQLELQRSVGPTLYRHHRAEVAVAWHGRNSDAAREFTGTAFYLRFLEGDWRINSSGGPSIDRF